MSPGAFWVADAGVWKKRNTYWTPPLQEEEPPTPPSGGRNSLIYEQYIPTEDTAGVPAGTNLTVIGPTDNLPTSTGIVAPTSSGYWRITKPNTTIYGLDIYGRVKVEASDFIGDTCRLRGRPKLVNPAANQHQPVLDMTSSLTQSGPAVWIDCTVSIDDPGPDQYGIKGRWFRCYRTIFEYGTDHAQVYNGRGEFWGCLFRNKVWHSNDPAHGSEGSHNDDIQFQGGTNSYLVVRGNAFHSGISPTGTSNIGIIVTADVSAPGGYEICGNAFYTRNSGGTAVSGPINMSTSTTTNFQVRNNKFELGRDGWHVIARSAIRTQVQNEPGNVDIHSGNPAIIANGGSG